MSDPEWTDPGPAADLNPEARDREDMAALCGGDSTALDRLMHRHGPRLLRFLRRMVGTDADAADLAQESFVRVFQHRDRFDTSRSFDTWLFTIGANLARNHLRSRGRTNRFEAAPSEEESGTPPKEVPSEAAGPGQVLVEEEARRLVRRAIDQLPEEMRAAVLLVDLEDHSLKQTSEILGIPARTVESRLYHARRTLRARLSRWLGLRRPETCGARSA